MKVGDKVYIAYCENNGDFNSSKATYGIIKTCDTNQYPYTTHIYIPDSKNYYSECWVFTSSIIPKEIYESPLFKLMSELEETK